MAKSKPAKSKPLPMGDKIVTLENIGPAKVLCYNPAKGKDIPVKPGDTIVLPDLYAERLLKKEPWQWEVTTDTPEEKPSTEKAPAEEKGGES